MSISWFTKGQNLQLGGNYRVTSHLGGVRERGDLDLAAENGWQIPSKCVGFAWGNHLFTWGM